MKNVRCKLLLICVAAMLASCSGDKDPTDVSEKPDAATATTTETLPHLSRLGIRARIQFDDFAELIRQELPATMLGDGTEKTCKRVIGIKVCGTAQWQYQINRGENIKVTGDNDRIVLQLPLDFNGIAGIRGDIAEALNLSRLQFNGALDASIHLGLNLDKNWCPVIDTQIDYTWTRTPRVKWTGGLKLNVRNHLDDAIAKQLTELQQKLAASIDCDRFRNEIQKHWRSYSFPLDVYKSDTMFLNLTPSGFSFSGIHTEADKLGVAFTLVANTVLQSQPIDAVRAPLPDVEQSDYSIGITEFELLVRADYQQLQKLAAPTLVNRVFTSDTAAGPVSVMVKSLNISGNQTGVTLELAFDADLPGTRGNTPGTVFLTALPHIDSRTNTISLREIQLTPVLDSALWNILTSVFEDKIIRTIQDKAVLDMGPNIKDLEQSLLVQLGNPATTSGLNINADNLSISLTRLQPERDALAAVMRADVQLDIDVPLSVLRTRRQ
ncbi:MAG: DUF4403 family protein [Granulosicoccus sp.]|nr:DUF4403 family protein [Granulosicoccus sp.]